ncbi:YdeI/OmpD-associated family protein [Pedobacter montanisoli]|uniref:YdeI/OmpD-associated family protein n=1 Tax=Pedobacter montanisoli TaxID=2923277 RepID=A0ABS9ZXL0_9SPHI|nr:YdeI/OmpD-associated family protein [Pedobacter montanisoli]MCJ0743064.1 YdeI/OmpD-associated family protein [Pedobacter montanisoli]
MVSFEAEIEKFDQKGEKTGWSYVFVPNAIAEQIKAGDKKSFRVKGKIDQVEVSGMSLVPMGEGDFILALKSSLRKKLRKEEGAKVLLQLSFDADFKIEMPDDLELCLSDEPEFLNTFLKMPKSHQNYYINWLNSAKTEPTRTKRLVMIVDAMAKKYDFGQMIRASKQ